MRLEVGCVRVFWEGLMLAFCDFRVCDVLIMATIVCCVKEQVEVPKLRTTSAERNSMRNM